MLFQFQERIERRIESRLKRGNADDSFDRTAEMQILEGSIEKPRPVPHFCRSTHEDRRDPRGIAAGLQSIEGCRTGFSVRINHENDRAEEELLANPLPMLDERTHCICVFVPASNDDDTSIAPREGEPLGIPKYATRSNEFFHGKTLYLSQRENG